MHLPFPRALAVTAAALLAVSPVRAERIDRVVAVVGDRVVTGWDLQLERSLEGHMPCPEMVLCDPQRLALERVADRALVRGLAGDTATYRPGPEDVELRLATLRDSWQPPEGYQQLLDAMGLSEHDLSGLLFSRLVVEHYVQRHVALPVYAAGGDEQAYQQRYDDWILEQRGQVRIRIIDADDGQSQDPGLETP